MKKSLILLVAAIMLFSMLSLLSASTYIDDGKVHIFNASNPVSGVLFIDTNNVTGPGSMVEIRPGGSIGMWLEAHHYSQVKMSGGVVEASVEANGYSQVDISGGLIGFWLDARDASQVTFQGGTLDGPFRAYQNSAVEISGGTVVQGFYGRDSSRIIMTGGTLGDDLRIEANSHFTMMGGQIKDSFYAADNSVLTLVGSDFRIDGKSYDYGDYHFSDFWQEITGTLADGSVLDNELHFWDETATLQLRPIPEPATLSLLALGAWWITGKKGADRRTGVILDKTC